MNNTFIGLGVAGNFAGHLEQAGEAADFLQVKTVEAVQPKAIFPFYVPSENLEEYQFLNTSPLSPSEIRFPNDADNLQIEPEIALICEIQYSDGKVTALLPTYFAAYNDCSIRRPNARKICEKKNWGEKSKGISANWLPLDHFNRGGVLDDFHIACFHKRNSVMNEYGIDSPAVGYSYFHQKLLDWIIDRMNHQPDEGPMNNIAALLEAANYPKQAIISIGATRYTHFGEHNFLQIGDTSIVAVYNAKRYTHAQIAEMAEKEQFAEDISALIQRVI
ncbi:DUF5718 family protein [Rodentibacter trehalosifermentans]|uniref:Valyl-tRNA synthetase n=1 Tax=Rodentibacter trehalosifermentans TaxID=1908263 RepID=A0A1V3IY85_9PAST|nr:DUF5718 family protein [Rodentibacter trehalosifermentans]OOF46833.1 hypothetical protein BKK53_11760 [Rodentibacter trehalosifermentans]OOF46986.1 hypothetical protein BKK51_00945 [Rodentibacter trehalosifermentans]